MDSDANVIQSSAGLVSSRKPASTTNPADELDAGYISAVAAGAPGIEGAINDSEETPLLSRRETLGTNSGRESSDEDDGQGQSSPIWKGDLDFEGLPWHKKPSIMWLLVPFLLFALVFGGTIVPGIEVVTQLLCYEKLVEQGVISSNSSITLDPTSSLMGGPSLDPEICNTEPRVQAAVSLFLLWGQVIGGLLAAATSPKLGSLSDRYGRLRFLAFTACGSLCKDFLFMLLFRNPHSMNVRWLLAAYGFDGLCGSFTTGMALTHAYASDCTPPNKRAVAFGWFHGSFFTGIALGPLLAAYVIKVTGQVVIMFYIAICIHFLFILFVLLVVPESLTKARQKAAREKRKHEIELANNQLNNGGGSSRVTRMISSMSRYNILAPLKILYPTGPGTSFPLRVNMIALAAVDTTMFAVAMGAMTVTILYTGAAFGWQDFERNIFMSIVNIARVTCLLVVLPAITRIFRGSPDSPKAGSKEQGCDKLDVWLVRVAVAFDMLGFVGYATASTGAVMIMSGVVASIGGMGSPTLQSSLTKHVRPDQVGQVLGAVGLLHALARIVAPMACNFIYARTVVIGKPQVVFIVLAITFALALIMSLFIKTGIYMDAKPVDEAPQHRSREEEVLIHERGEEDEFI